MILHYSVMRWEDANRALALRVVWATLKEACGREGEPKLTWTTFLASLRFQQVLYLRLQQAMNYYCEVAKRASTPRLLLVDETAYALTIDPTAGHQMCAEVLYQLDTLQEESLRVQFWQPHNCRVDECTQRCCAFENAELPTTSRISDLQALLQKHHGTPERGLDCRDDEIEERPECG